MEKLDNIVQIIEQFNRQPMNDKFLFGTGQFSTKAVDLFEFNGFVEEVPQRPILRGKSVFALNSIPRGRVILVGSSLYPFTASSKLKEQGFIPLHLLYYLKREFGANIYFPDFESHYLSNRVVYDELHSVLSDELSKELLCSLINFRIFADINYLWGRKSGGEQYFEDFLKLDKGEIFYDIGAFDGETSIRFNEATKGTGFSILFEPNPRLHQKLTRLCAKELNFKLQPYALSDCDTIASFRPELGSASRLEDEEDDSTVRIATRKLDGLRLREIPTYLKLDIEGNEMKALNGAKETINKYRPKLAISVYHRLSDIADAYLFCRQQINSAKYFLRHYTEGTDETVLYCIPD